MKAFEAYLTAIIDNEQQKQLEEVLRWADDCI